MSMPTYIYIILVDGNISSDGWFTEEEKPEAERVAKKYKTSYTVEVRRIRNYTVDLT